jgi:hypothetical protein
MVAELDPSIEFKILDEIEKWDETGGIGAYARRFLSGDLRKL